MAPSIATDLPNQSYIAASAAVSLATWLYDGAAVARAEDVGRAATGVVPVGPNHDGVAVDRHGPAELVARRGVGGRQLGHLAIRGTAVGRAEDVDRTWTAAAVVISLRGPTTMVSPSIAKEVPVPVFHSSYAPPSAAVSFATSW